MRKEFETLSLGIAPAHGQSQGSLISERLVSKSEHKMYQMDLLVTHVSELLTAAVQEVLHVMGQAVSEYQKEAARTRLENQNLQLKLKEIQKRRAVISEFTFTIDEPYSGEHHETENIVYHGQSPVEEHLESLSDSMSFTEENHVHVTLVDDKCHSLQGVCGDSLNKQRFSSQSPSSPSNIHNPLSPEAPVTSHPEKPLGIILSRIKVESKPEPSNCFLREEADNVTTDASVLSVLDGPPAEHECNQQPFSTNIVCYNQTHKLLNSTSFISNILRSRMENTVDVHNAPTISGLRENSHICHMCGKTFANSSSLGAHFVCHSNERPYACKCCNFRFSRLADLKKHERIHTGERPYKCSLCGRRFNRTENLKRHFRKLHYGVGIPQTVNSILE